MYAKAEPTLRIRIGFYLGRHGMTVGDLREACRELSRPAVQAELEYGETKFLAVFAGIVARVMETRQAAERKAARAKQAEADRIRAEADRPAAREVLRLWRERHGPVHSPIEDFDYEQGEDKTEAG